MSLRAKIIVYLVLIHAVLAAISFLVLRENPLWLLAVEGLFVLSIVLGVLLVRAFFVPLDLIRTGAELIGERDFTSQFREVGQPEMDALIRIYNQMIDRLREERLKLQEQHYFLDRILAASPAGILTLDFDGRVTSLNPAAERLLQVSPGGGEGKELRAAALGPALAAIPAGGSEVLALQGGRRIKVVAGGVLRPRLPAQLPAAGGADGGAAGLGEGGLRQADPDDVARDQQLGGRGGLAARLLPRLRAAELGEEDRDDFLQAITVAITRLENLRAFMNGFAEVVRLPPPDRRPTDVKQLVDEILMLLRPELDRRRIAVDWEASEAIPPVELDRNQIEQVLVNVLKNAMESIGEDGDRPDLGFEGGRTELGPGRPCLSIRTAAPASRRTSAPSSSRPSSRPSGTAGAWG